MKLMIIHAESLLINRNGNHQIPHDKILSQYDIIVIINVLKEVLQ